MDPSQQLARLYQAGFDVQTFERFPRSVAVVRDNCVALLETTPEGLKIAATPGWRVGEGIGVLVEQGGRQVFQYKSETVEATPERLETLRKFREELENVLAAAA
ncbi:MAG TPA: hypothetical protein VMT28_07195 [Terriglobales bacterium]|jgi:hypothetical protein|nr:hypothetical protein [Terriglobales bacterium]